MTAHARQDELASLPIGKVLHVAWRGLRIRLGRSLLVVSCIALAIAFLSYILASDALTLQLRERASAELLERLARQGQLEEADAAGQRVQMLWMVALALLISFVGIVNAMLMSVTERFREIGTMKCLGALDSFVMRLFLVESVFQGAAGAVVGVVLGLALAYGEGLAAYGLEVFRLVAPGEMLRVMAACFAAGLGITVLGALYPAYRAARMAPVMALRSEV